MREAAALSFIVSGQRGVERKSGEEERRGVVTRLVPGIHNLEAIVEFRRRKDPLVAWDN